MGKQAAYVNDIKIDFGPAHIEGRLLGVKRTDASSKFTYCTPDGLAVHQVYQDDFGNEYTVADLHRALKEPDGTLKYIGKEAVEDAKKSDLPLNHVHFSVYTPESVEQFLHPSNNQSYVLEPGFKSGSDGKGPWVGRGHPKLTAKAKEWIKYYDFMVALMDSGAVFLGAGNIKHFEGLYRLTKYQGYLTLQRQSWPDELNQFDELLTQIDPASHKKGLKMVTAMLSEFEPDNFKATTKEKLANLLAGDYTPGETPEQVVEEEFDLLAALEGYGD